MSGESQSLVRDPLKKCRAAGKDGLLVGETQDGLLQTGGMMGCCEVGEGSKSMFCFDFWNV